MQNTIEMATENQMRELLANLAEQTGEIEWEQVSHEDMRSQFQDLSFDETIVEVLENHMSPHHVDQAMWDARYQ